MKNLEQELTNSMDGIYNMLSDIKEKLSTLPQEQENSQLGLLIDQVNNIYNKVEELNSSKILPEQLEVVKKEMVALCFEVQKRLFPPHLAKSLLLTLEKLNKTIEEPQTSITKHQHTIDIKSSKPLFIWIGLFLILIGSLILNTSQYSKNQKLKDNDLKYRSILMVGSINGKELNNLQETFHRQRNKRQIEKIRIMVEDFEYKCKREAELQERMRLIDDQ